MREIRIHDTLSGELRPLEPREPGKVGIYACGPTVYARVHVGNARPFVVFALLKRFLEHEGLEVTLVENVTDVNDKIYDAANAAGSSSQDLADEMTAHYVDDTSRLGLGRPDHEPKAAATVDAIVALIADLIEGGHAYEAGGDVYFRVDSFPAYGKLSNRPPLEMRQGEGDDAAQLKESPRDFALWKAHKEGEDTKWPAPWGEGRPGWHIECSAMAEQLLGTDFEIHGGGSDLVFPHHENEIAQTEAARGEPLARIWMHNGMLQLGDGGEKMAKSVGNIHLLHAALDEYGRDALIAYFTSGHYRQPIGYSGDALAEAQRSVDRLRELGRRLDRDAPRAGGPGRLRRALLRPPGRRLQHPRGPRRAVRVGGRGQPPPGLGRHGGGGRAGGHAAGAGPGEPAGGRRRRRPGRRRRRPMLAEREQARAERDFARADELRDRLAAAGWVVRDTPEGARLVRG